MLFFICGPHAAGKTSIIKRLKHENVISSAAPEIGKQLFYAKNFRPEMQNKNFELEIFHRELNRDKLLINSNSITAIETWHPGNIAYAVVRNPQIVPQMVTQLKEIQYIKKSYGIYLALNADKIKERTVTFKEKSDWAADFYSQINKEIINSIALLDLESNTIKIDASANFDTVYENVKLSISKIINSNLN